MSAIEGVAPRIFYLDSKYSFTPRLLFPPGRHGMIGVICLRTGLKFLANEDVVASAANRTPVHPNQYVCDNAKLYLVL